MKLLKTSGAILIAAMVFTACKKDANRSSLILGTWTQTKLIQDNNSNGIADDSVLTVPPGISVKVTFSSNNTGKIVQTQPGASTTTDFTWSLTNNDNTLQIVEASTTVSVSIIELSNSNLTVENKATSPYMWSYFSK